MPRGRKGTREPIEVRREKNRLGAARHRLACPERVRELRRASYQRRKTFLRTRQRKERLHKLYGLTPEDVASMIAAQNNRCAICGDIMRGPRNQHIDHDHRTGKIRGVLCCKCNTSLGYLEHPNWREWLVKAEAYLRLWVGVEQPCGVPGVTHGTGTTPPR